MVKKIITQKQKEQAIEVKIEAKAPLRSKKCQFCQNKSVPSYADSASLRRFLTDRARITPRSRSGLCSKHQRFATREIKYARHLGLLPFTPKV